MYPAKRRVTLLLPRVAFTASSVPSRPRCCNAVCSAALGSWLCRCCCSGCWRPARTQFPHSLLHLPSVAEDFSPFIVPACVMVEPGP